jgi:hypothetical protein
MKNEEFFINTAQFFILHFSFFIEFCEAKFRWASRFACAAWLRHLLARSRRAIRSITRLRASHFGG